MPAELANKKCKKALLLAAGIGSRLRPLTNYIPKCLMPINGRPLLDIWLEQLFTAGIEEIYVNTSYKHEVVEFFLKNHPRRDQIHVVYEKQLLGTAGTIAEVSSLIPDETMMVIYADNLSVFPVSEFILAHFSRPQSSLITMMTFESPDPSSCGIVKLNQDGVVEEFFEKAASPPGNLANGAVFIIEPEVLAEVRRKWNTKYKNKLETRELAEFDFCRDVIPQYLNQIFSWHNQSFHQDIGQPKAYLASLSEIKSKFPRISTFDSSTWDLTVKKFDLESMISKSFDELRLARGTS